jgi:hypothetical protein
MIIYLSDYLDRQRRPGRHGRPALSRETRRAAPAERRPVHSFNAALALAAVASVPGSCLEEPGGNVDELYAGASLI